MTNYLVRLAINSLGNRLTFPRSAFQLGS